MVALNRLQLSYAAPVFSDPASRRSDFRLTIGRQRIFFGDGRFIGNAEWRQHEQTFDAISLNETPMPGTTLSYSYVAGVNRVFGPDSPMGRYDSHSHLFNAVYGGFLPALKLEGYAYLLDLRQTPTFSTATYGARAEGLFALGSGWSAKVNAAFAKQSDYAKNPLPLGVAYYLGEAGIGFQGLTALAGYEVLQGNGTMGFQTPLANLHPFQGWAETFLLKPPNGLRDAYGKLSYSLSPGLGFQRITATAAYHDFSAEHVHAEYGSEWDTSVGGQVGAHLFVDAAYADYRGADPFPAKRVFWLYSTYRY
jgi:hypothetical protein